MEQKTSKISPIKRRVLEYVDFRQITKQYFCEKTGISYGNIKGKSLESEIGGSQIAEILSVFSDLSPEWLVTGNGSMLKSDEKAPKLSQEIPTTAIAIPCQDKKMVGIPLIPMDAIAGFNGFDNEGVLYDSCEHYYIPEFTRMGVEFLVRVSGDSMMPMYYNADILACTKIKDILFFQWGNTYVIDCSQGIMVKRIFEDRQSKEHVICMSENKDNYPAFSIPKEDIRSLSVIVGLIRIG